MVLGYICYYRICLIFVHFVRFWWIVVEMICVFYEYCFCIFWLMLMCFSLGVMGFDWFGWFEYYVYWFWWVLMIWRNQGLELSKRQKWINMCLINSCGWILNGCCQGYWLLLVNVWGFAGFWLILINVGGCWWYLNWVLWIWCILFFAYWMSWVLVDLIDFNLMLINFAWFFIILWIQRVKRAKRSTWLKISLYLDHIYIYIYIPELWCGPL